MCDPDAILDWLDDFEYQYINRPIEPDSDEIRKAVLGALDCTRRENEKANKIKIIEKLFYMLERCPHYMSDVANTEFRETACAKCLEFIRNHNLACAYCLFVSLICTYTDDQKKKKEDWRHLLFDAVRQFNDVSKYEAENC